MMETVRTYSEMSEWVRRAQAEEDNRPLQESYYVNFNGDWFYACADGFRIHAAKVSGLPEHYIQRLADDLYLENVDGFESMGEWLEQFAKNPFKQQFAAVQAVPTRSASVLDVHALWRNAAIAVQTDKACLTLKFSEDGIQIELDEEEYGGELVEGYFMDTVPDLIINAQYLCDALSAFRNQESVDLRYVPTYGGFHMLVVGDPNDQFAIIMPMKANGE